MELKGLILYNDHVEAELSTFAASPLIDDTVNKRITSKSEGEERTREFLTHVREQFSIDQLEKLCEVLEEDEEYEGNREAGKKLRIATGFDRDGAKDEETSGNSNLTRTSNGKTCGCVLCRSPSG